MTAAAGKPGRPNQKSRTRKDLLRAASRLMKEGRSPTLEEVAEEALVSRATAYRYFSGIEALLVEAALDVAMPDEGFFAEDASDDVVERLLRADRAVAAMIAENETALRAMLVHSLQRGMEGAGHAAYREAQRAYGAEGGRDESDQGNDPGDGESGGCPDDIQVDHAVAVRRGDQPRHGGVDRSDHGIPGHVITRQPQRGR